MKILEEKEITRLKSLCYLLSDDDESIYNTARNHLLEAGVGALPLLQANQDASDPVLRERSKGVYDEICSVLFKEQWRSFVATSRGVLDLETGAFLIPKLAYPETDMRIFSDLLNFYANEFQARLDAGATPEEIVHSVSRFFAEEKGFGGRDADYYDPDNHFLQRVIERKKGVPISLSVVYLLVLGRLNLPVHGVGLPGHFIVRLDLGESPIFADPFDQGRIISVDECRQRMNRMGYSFGMQYLEPVSTKQILERMLRNLQLVFEKRSDSSKVELLTQCIDILSLSH
ncbi:MAG TPA: transglutaminase-like domain-containing protein [Bacteroidota bacterium]|nr:transglutaminase-like domain-containing protein [Bacteroidota bacterium]